MAGEAKADCGEVRVLWELSALWLFLAASQTGSSTARPIAGTVYSYSPTRLDLEGVRRFSIPMLTDVSRPFPVCGHPALALLTGRTCRALLQPGLQGSSATYWPAPTPTATPTLAIPFELRLGHLLYDLQTSMKLDKHLRFIMAMAHGNRNTNSVSARTSRSW